MAEPFWKDFQGKCSFVFLIIHVVVTQSHAWSKLGDQELHSATAVFGGVLPALSRGGKGSRAVHAQKLSWIAAS